jgi:hypothetical protein
MDLEQKSRNQSFTRPLITSKDQECISIFTANLLIGIALVFGGTGKLTKLKRNLSVNKPVSPKLLSGGGRFPAQPVFKTHVFFSYRLSTLKLRL